MNANVNGMDPRGTGIASIGMTIAGKGVGVGGTGDERSERVRITLSLLIFSAAYNLQRVRYRHTHVPRRP